MSTEARLSEAHAAIVAIYRAKEKQWLGESDYAEALEAARAAAIEQVDDAWDRALYVGIPAAAAGELAAKARAAINALADARWPEHRLPHAGEVWPALWPLQHAALEACREIVGRAAKPLPGSRAGADAIDNIAQLVPAIIAMRQRLDMLQEADRLRDAAFPDGARPKFYLVPASTAQAERESGAAVPPLKECDVAILKALAAAQPRVLTLVDLEVQIDVSRKTIGKRLTYLIGHDLAKRPFGERAGARITAAGLAAITSQPVR